MTPGRFRLSEINKSAKKQLHGSSPEKAGSEASSTGVQQYIYLQKCCIRQSHISGKFVRA